MSVRPVASLAAGYRSGRGCDSDLTPAPIAAVRAWYGRLQLGGSVLVAVTHPLAVEIALGLRCGAELGAASAAVTHAAGRGPSPLPK